VDDGLKPLEIGGIHVPEIFPDGRNPGSRRPKVAVFKKPTVQPYNFMAGGHQHGCGNRTDVTEMTG
jgi:hypothetical protein